MRSEKALVSLIRKLAKVIAVEAARNPEFAAELAQLLPEPTGGRRNSKPQKPKPINEPLPEIHAEWAKRGEAEFRFWARDLPVLTLRALIRREDLDPTRKTSRWKDAEKLAAHLADGLKTRKERGSAFLGETS